MENGDDNHNNQVSSQNNPDDFAWEITKIDIYTLNFVPIFSTNYTSSINQFDSSVVMQFYETVQKFAENNLGTRLVDFKVNDERIFFKVSQEHIYIITVRLGNKAECGLLSDLYVKISALFTDLVSILFFQESVNEFGENEELQELIAEVVEDTNAHATIEDTGYSEIEDLNIGYSLISDEVGIPIVSRIYDGSSFNDDPMLLTMFLHALNVFFSTNFSDNLREINFGNSRLYIKNIEGHFYAIMVQFDDYVSLREDSPVHAVSFKLLDQMVDLVSELRDDFDIISDEALELMIDNFIFKAQYQLKDLVKSQT